MTAPATLDTFMAEQSPNPARFVEAIGTRIRSLQRRAQHHAVHVYGEMVDLLWESGNRDGVGELEDLWTSLMRESTFRLLCGYRISAFDRDATGFTSLCHPGESGVRACPCGNPPAASGRGCDNSAATGGAFLTAIGAAYLSSESLVFTTYAEKPTALSVLMQGDALNSGGVVYGQGVRCVGGSLLRLYSKSASVGNPSSSERAASASEPSNRSPCGSFVPSTATST